MKLLCQKTSSAGVLVYKHQFILLVWDSRHFYTSLNLKWSVLQFTGAHKLSDFKCFKYDAVHYNDIMFSYVVLI